MDNVDDLSGDGMARRRRYKTNAYDGPAGPLLVVIGGRSVLHRRSLLLCPQEDAVPPCVMASLRPFRQCLSLSGIFFLPDLIGHCICFCNVVFLIFSFYTTFHSVIINPSNKKGRVNCPAFLLRVNY